MARLLFPDNGSRLALTVEGRPAAAHVYTVYTDAAGTVLASIAADSSGTPGAVIADSKLTTDAYGYLPYFWGPSDDTTRLYVTDGIAPVWPVDADDRARINAGAPAARSIATTAPLTGGGDLTADRTLGVADATSGAVGVIRLAGDLAGTASAPTIATGAVTSAKIADATIVDGDIAAGAAIAPAKIAGTALTANNNLSDVNAATARTNLGVDASSLVLHLAGDEVVTGAKTFNLGTLLDKGNHVYDGSAYAGVDKTGATDSAAGLQTAIDASPFGSVWFLPVGTYRLDSVVTLNRGRSLVGAGFYHARDVSPIAFGDNWSGNTTFTGTVIRSTVTSGPAILVTSNGGNDVMAGCRLKDFLLIGPGSGASHGIGMGESSPSTRAVIRPIVANVKVANFSVGMRLEHVNEAAFDLAVQGCTKGVSAGVDVNNIRWNQANIQRCADGFVFEDTGSANDQFTNEFAALICQNITGTALVVRGKGHTFLSPYFEETPTAANFAATAHFCVMVSPTVQGAGVKTMTVTAGASNNKFLGLETNAGAFTITNAGAGNWFQGILVGLTDTGSNTWQLDTNNAVLRAPKYVANSTSGPSVQYGSAFGARFGASGAQVWQGTGSPEGAITAPVGSTYQRTDGGAGTSFYVKESGSGNTGWAAK